MTALLIILAIAILIPFAIMDIRDTQEAKIERERHLKENSIYVSDFYKMKKELELSGYSTDGAYVFTNLSKGNIRYVGQSIDIINRVSTHLSGRGNELIYSDIQNGDSMVVEFIKLKDTGFSNLNNLERSLISDYNSYYNGYNRTRGNR